MAFLSLTHLFYWFLLFIEILRLRNKSKLKSDQILTESSTI